MVPVGGGEGAPGWWDGKKGIRLEGCSETEVLLRDAVCGW